MAVLVPSPKWAWSLGGVMHTGWDPHPQKTGPMMRVSPTVIYTWPSPQLSDVGLKSVTISRSLSESTKEVLLKMIA